MALVENMLYVQACSRKGTEEGEKEGKGYRERRILILPSHARRLDAVIWLFVSLKCIVTPVRTKRIERGKDCLAPRDILSVGLYRGLLCQELSPADTE